MNREDVLNEFRNAGALLEGHFILSSGRHSAVYLQCARVLMNAERAARLCRALADKVRQHVQEPIGVVVSPAMGGVVVGYEMGRQLGVDAMFTERVDGTFVLRRGFHLGPGQKVLMVEDVVTTGLSSRECISAIRETGAVVVAGACLVDRSNGKADIGVPLIALTDLDAASYAPDEVPDALSKIPAVKPGSRGLQS